MRVAAHILLRASLCWLSTTTGDAIGLPTSTVAVVGTFHQGPPDVPLEVDAAGFVSLYGSEAPASYPAEAQARQFFRNGGTSLYVVRVAPGRPLADSLVGSTDPLRPVGLGALLPLSELGLVICPELTTLPDPALNAGLTLLETLGATRPLFLLLDPPPGQTTVADAIAWRQAHLPPDLAHAALYFPYLSVDPAGWSGGSSASRVLLGASGSMAAAIVQNDASEGIWDTPAGTDLTLTAEGLSLEPTTGELEDLNLAHINSLRDFTTFGILAWGGRTLDAVHPAHKFLAPVRTRRWNVRSLERAFASASVEVNGPALWSNLESQASGFLHSLFTSGAFAGTSPGDSYFAKCDSETTTAADVAAHRVNIVIGCAFVRPAEFDVDTITVSTLDVNRPVPEVPLFISSPVNGTAMLFYPTTPGFNHSLQSSETLLPGQWFDPGSTAGDGRWIRKEVPLFGSRLFYQVETTPGW